MPLFSNMHKEIDKNSIKFSYREIDDKVVDSIALALSEFNLEDKYYKLVFSHSYHQIMKVLDEFFERDSTSSIDFVLPDYETREDNSLIIKKPLLNNYCIKKDRNDILIFIENTCNVTVLNGVKGVAEYVHRKKRW